MSKSAHKSEIASPSVFEWLQSIRKNPRSHAITSIAHLESQIFGYYTALGVHGIVERVSPLGGPHFRTWVYFRTNWSTSNGFAHAIATHVSDPNEQFAKFFQLVDEYKNLLPTVVYTVALGENHQPTGKRLRVYRPGVGVGTIEKPRRVDIVCYKPEPLHFFRFHYADRTEDGSILRQSDCSYGTTIHDAKKWARDELQVEPNEWKTPA